MSSFFSLHRPISLSRPFPNHTDQDVFDQIFEPSSSNPKDPRDVMYTLSNTIDSLENATQDQSGEDLHWTIVQESSSASGGVVKHLDGSPRTKTLEEIVGHLKPFKAPPAPEPWPPAQSQSQTQRKASAQRALQSREPDRAYQTTIVIHETTGENGEKYFSTSTTPMVQISTGNNISSKRHLPSRTSPHTIRAPTIQHQPFLTRLLTRNAQYAQTLTERSYHEPPSSSSEQTKPREGEVERQERQEGGIVISRVRRERARHEMGKMEAISVKRQRKLKMKKHKYKKLMKKTRNLRRRLDRT